MLPIKHTSLQSQNQSLPWVGSYFEIPEPAGFQPYTGFSPNELEIHILKKDTTVRTMVLKYSHKEAMFLDGDILVQLENMAYLDDNAIAFKVYHFTVNRATGVRTEGFLYSPVMRLGKKTWCRLEQRGDSYTQGAEFSPEIYQTLSKYRNH